MQKRKTRRQRENVVVCLEGQRKRPQTEKTAVAQSEEFEVKNETQVSMDSQDCEVDVVVSPAPDIIVLLHAFKCQEEEDDVDQNQEGKGHCNHDNRECVVHV